jgi:hypothetical protein
MNKCTYCNQDLVWIAATANGPRRMCNEHYSQFQRDKKADRINTYLGRPFQALTLTFSHAS